MEEQSLSQRLHIDIPLLLGVVVLCIIGLFILYSAGGQDIDLVYRQAIKLTIALVGMLIIAQLPPAEIERWSLWLFLFGQFECVAFAFLGGVTGLCCGVVRD